MNVTQQGIITILKSALTGLKYDLPEDFVFDAQEIKDFIKKHQIMQLYYVGAVNCGVLSEHPYMNSLFMIYCKHLVRSEKQMKEVKRVCQAFDQKGIDYLPTKGCNMKALYPKPEMRVMGDADITIRKEQSSKTAKVMTELGFSLSADNAYEQVWDSEALHLELHKHMRSFYNENYYDDVWERVERGEGNRYIFTTEDALIHLFNHFARHYRGAGIGCRQILDLYVYRQAFPQMNEDYICQEMKKIHLLDFYKNVCHLLDVWFGDAASNEVTEIITRHIFYSGSWGDKTSLELSKSVSQANKTGKVSNSRFKGMLNSIFLPKEEMLWRYKILEKAPFLLPFLWVVRAFRILLFERKKITKKADVLRSIEDERVSEQQKYYKLVGLDSDINK